MHRIFLSTSAENRLLHMGQIVENFKQLGADNLKKPAKAMQDGNVAGGVLGYGVSAWDVATRSGDALFQGIAGRKIEDANALGDVQNVVACTVKAVGNVLTFRPKELVKNVISGTSSAFQAPQSLVTQAGRAATGTDYKLAA
ncbi:MAG: hypothetical protein PHU04_05750 [Candidatus Peribacteraceae bacterium]|nr:hypothetical protein [Candidatus Peribacteraceae bacterium]